VWFKSRLSSASPSPPVLLLAPPLLFLYKPLPFLTYDIIVGWFIGFGGSAWEGRSSAIDAAIGGRDVLEDGDLV